MHGMNLNTAVFPQELVSRVPQDLSSNVYRTITKRSPGPFISCEQVTGLGGTPGAELYQRQVADLGMNLRGIRAENLPFRPIWIVLGQCTNPLVQLGATLIIKILCRQPFLWGGKTMGHVPRKDGLVRLYTHIIKLESLVGECFGPHGCPLPRSHLHCCGGDLEASSSDPYCCDSSSRSRYCMVV